MPHIAKGYDERRRDWSPARPAMGLPAMVNAPFAEDDTPLLAVVAGRLATRRPVTCVAIKRLEPGSR